MQMHHGDDHYLILLWDVKNAIGEAMNQRTPNVAPHFLPGEWKYQPALNGSMYLSCEVQP